MLMFVKMKTKYRKTKIQSDIVCDVDGIENADLVLLVTTRPTTGNTLAWAVACERDQWGRAIAGEISSFFP